MTENELSIVIKAALDTGFAAFVSAGLMTAAPTIKIRHQPITVGIPSQPTVFWTAISDEFFGFLKRTDVWNAETSMMVHTEEQPVITTFQFNATCIQDPSNTSQLTAKDYLNYAKSILQSDVTRLALNAQSVQVLRVKTGRQTYWIDDKKRMEADPSFDLEFAHTSTIVTVTPSTTELTTGIYPV